jgi:hypothetical protein
VPAEPDEEYQRRVKAWVEYHCAEQGLPVKVSDPLTLDRIAAIFASAREKRTQA